MKDIDSVARVLGVDVGGAHIKLADASGLSLALAFPMWLEADRLADHVRELTLQFCRVNNKRYTHLAVTMTGEMADCFATRRIGVEFILRNLTEALPELSLHVYCVDGSWLEAAQACRNPWDVAASNWHGLANWISRSVVPRDDNLRLVLDIGSTTVDVIPVANGRVATAARTDSDRLRLQQLVYTGVGRTPAAAILSSATIHAMQWPLVAERFATSDDAYVTLGLTAVEEREEESPKDLVQRGSRVAEAFDTADGRPRTLAHARARLARMLAEDCERLTGGEVEMLAQQMVDKQASQVAQAIAANLPAVSRVHRRPLIILSGHGSALARAALQKLPQAVDCIDLAQRISPTAARCAPAVAVAWLLQQRLAAGQL